MMEKEKILKNVNLKIIAKQKIALVGPQGLEKQPFLDFYSNFMKIIQEKY